MPPRQRRGRRGLAAGARILRVGHADRLDGDTKETRDVSNIEYFGDPLYTYSLRQGIADGFLAPYKVVRIGIDRDLDGWRPEKGKTDK